MLKRTQMEDQFLEGESCLHVDALFIKIRINAYNDFLDESKPKMFISRAEHVRQFIVENAAMSAKPFVSIVIELNDFVKNLPWLTSTISSEATTVGIKWYDVPWREIDTHMFRAFRKSPTAYSGSIVLPNHSGPGLSGVASLPSLMQQFKIVPLDLNIGKHEEEEKKWTTVTAPGPIIDKFFQDNQLKTSIRLDVNGPQGTTFEELENAMKVDHFVKIKWYPTCWSLLEALKGVEEAKLSIQQGITEVHFFEPGVLWVATQRQLHPELDWNGRWQSEMTELDNRRFYSDTFLSEFLKFQEQSSLYIKRSDFMQQTLEKHAQHVAHESELVDLASNMIGLDPLPTQLNRLVVQHGYGGRPQQPGNIQQFQPVKPTLKNESSLIKRKYDQVIDLTRA